MFSKRQARYLLRAQMIKVYFDKNDKLVVVYVPLKEELTLFLENLGLVESYLPQKDTKGKGQTTGKDVTKKLVAKESSTVCGFAKSYALAVGDTELEEAMGCCYSDVLKMKDTELLGWVTKQYDLLSPLVDDAVFAKYGVTEELLETLLTDAKAFNEKIGQGKVTNNDSYVANANINKAIAALNKNIKQFDLLVQFFAKTNPDFVSGYLLNKKLNDAGVKHSGVAGVVVKKGTTEPVEGAVVRLAGTTKEVTSTVTGTYEIIKVKTGDYRLEVLVGDVVVYSVIIHINRGNIQELTIAV